MNYFCNPLNLSYKYSFIRPSMFSKKSVTREAADPSMVLFHGRYYLFASMSAGFWVSDDLAKWEFHSLKNVPIHDYAPDVRVIGQWMYFSASKRGTLCSFYRSKDPIHEEFEEIPGTFPFWDPNLFWDEDGKVYFYWGCTNIEPIWGVELNPNNMTMIGEKTGLFYGQPELHGFEKNGEDHVLPEPKTLSEKMMRNFLGTAPFIEGPWMTKHNGKYYLQYAAPGTQYNVYADGVYESDHPLGPFSYAKNNPFSYKPAGFITGAGHGSTFADRLGNWWHASTLRISVGQNFERRLGLFPAGFDEDGHLFCNQRYGDWPMPLKPEKADPWAKPEWMLLSYGKSATASSFVLGNEPELATKENIRQWWKPQSPKPGSWLNVDLGQIQDVRAIQINFADDALKVPLPKKALVGGGVTGKRFIDERQHATRWMLEGSLDGSTYFLIEDHSRWTTDLSHDLVIRESGIRVRHVRCTIIEVPFGQTPCLSGLRVFGIGTGPLPPNTTGTTVVREADLEARIRWNPDAAVGHNILWGFAPNRLYHSQMVYEANELLLKALNHGQDCFIRIDAFNENGITEGEILPLR